MQFCEPLATIYLGPKRTLTWHVASVQMRRVFGRSMVIENFLEAARQISAKTSLVERTNAYSLFILLSDAT
jgi:hypothetical protein